MWCVVDFTQRLTSYDFVRGQGSVFLATVCQELATVRWTSTGCSPVCGTVSGPVCRLEEDHTLQSEAGGQWYGTLNSCHRVINHAVRRRHQTHGKAGVCETQVHLTGSDKKVKLLSHYVVSSVHFTDTGILLQCIWQIKTNVKQHLKWRLSGHTIITSLFWHSLLKE